MLPDLFFCDTWDPDHQIRSNDDIKSTTDIHMHHTTMCSYMLQHRRARALESHTCSLILVHMTVKSTAQWTTAQQTPAYIVPSTHQTCTQAVLPTSALSAPFDNPTRQKLCKQQWRNRGSPDEICCLGLHPFTNAVHACDLPCMQIRLLCRTQAASKNEHPGIARRIHWLLSLQNDAGQVAMRVP